MEFKNKHITFLLFVFILISCSTTNINKRRNILGYQVNYTLPRINQHTLRHKGDIVVFKVLGGIKDAIMITEDFNFIIDDFDKKIDSGAIFIKDFRMNKKYFFTFETDLNVGIMTIGDGAFRPFKVENDKIRYGKKLYNLKCTEHIFPIPNTKFKQNKLIYEGKYDNILEFTFYQYINQNEVPNVVEKINFDMSKKKILKFKGLEINIIRADSSFFEYELLETFQ